MFLHQKYKKYSEFHSEAFNIGIMIERIKTIKTYGGFRFIELVTLNKFSTMEKQSERENILHKSIFRTPKKDIILKDNSKRLPDPRCLFRS